jgi:3-oxochol-4-en-24-oyl-CoA dehydrogenase
VSLGISDEHLELHRAVRRWTETNAQRAVARSALEAADEHLPPFWADLAEQGWLGLHLPERYGGQGYGRAESAIVVEELGRVCAPGPLLPSVAASAVIAAGGSDEQRDRWLPGLADGSLVGAFGTSGAPVMGAALADVFVLQAGRDLVVADRSAVAVTPRTSLDATRRVASADLEDPEGPGVGRLEPAAVAVVAGLVAADAVGGAAWCVDVAAEYAKARVQFGRPIGRFQAVKHRCADMLLRLELARAAAWDAVRATEGDDLDVASAAASAVAVEAYFAIAKDCIQVLGGIGYTWEHDAHLYLKRATAMRQLFPAHPERVAALALAGRRRSLSVDLPPEAEPHRIEVRRFLEDLENHERSEWNRRIADAGYLVPYWPTPWGRGAGPLEQLVIDEEFGLAGVRRPHLQVGAWVLPTLIAHGTIEQQERWIPPTMHGDILWCQMFSEPGAGSDLASLSTRAERVEGGWSLTGQKVWTTMAHVADWAICLARTDPDAPKHDGITCFMLDMTTPGVEVRPLRELTGAEMFNEVFLDGAFVPNDCVVGGVDNGWSAARTTLANERVSMGSGSSFGPGVEAILRLVADRGLDPPVDNVVAADVGALVAESHAVAVLGIRSTLRALAGAEPGPEASVRKLLGVEHEQRVQEVGLSLLGPEAAANDGGAAIWIGGFLGNRALSIAGGTSDVQRNIIAERLLGLPREPEGQGN